MPTRSRQSQRRCLISIPEAEGEHAVQASCGRRPFFLVEVDDDLGVRIAAEAVALGLQLAAQIFIIVDLAVVGQPDRPVLVRHGLTARRRKIDNGQALMAQARLHAGTVGLGKKCIPVSSGPRRAMAAHMERINSGLNDSPLKLIFPQIPHMLYRCN